MSASLVGSEMCIRDSMASPTSNRQPLLPALAAARSVKRFAHSALPVAVSYTHLTLPTICSV
eukprot:526107-Alexandrium_andersonii.AAC.1